MPSVGKPNSKYEQSTINISNIHRVSSTLVISTAIEDLYETFAVCVNEHASRMSISHTNTECLDKHITHMDTSHINNPVIRSPSENKGSYSHCEGSDSNSEVSITSPSKSENMVKEGSKPHHEGSELHQQELLTTMNKLPSHLQAMEQLIETMECFQMIDNVVKKQ